jgi:hypothetical protein
MSNSREDFEQWVKDTAKKFEYAHTNRLLERIDDDEDGYTTTWVDCAWMGWQARTVNSLVPTDWKLAPLESTSDMDFAAGVADLDIPVDRDHAEAIWRIMIATAPQPPKQD